MTGINPEKLLADPGLIDLIEADLGNAGIAGEEDLRLVLYLVGTSRILADPLHAIVQGESSSGKSYLVKRIAALFPEDHVINATHVSPKALYYSGDIRHRFLVTGERPRAEGPEVEDAMKAFRELRSDGRLTSMIVGKSGKLERKVAEGPVSSVETTTKESLFGEDANRCILLSTQETEDQTKRILRAQASAARGEAGGDPASIRERHRALQKLLARGCPHRVRVGFADRLVEAFPTARTEARRAFPMLLGLVSAITVLHRFQRATGANGIIEATVEDYALAKRLLDRPLASSIGGAATERLARFATSMIDHVNVGDTFTARDIALHLGVRPQRVNDALRGLADLGIVKVTEESRGPHPATWELVSDKLPETTFGLPDPGLLR